MKARESGMPEEAYWESLFDIETVLQRLGVDHGLTDLVELGCGYGTFTIPAARRIRGVLTTLDIDPEMVARTRERAREAGLDNVVCLEKDVFSEGFGVARGSQDGCLLFNILHCDDPVGLLAAGAMTLREAGQLYVIHWRCDPATPRGPSMDIRPSPGMIKQWAARTGLLAPSGGEIDLPPWHYGLRFCRKGGVG